LLTMLDGADVMVPMDYGFSSFGERAQISTRDIPFIACGAFSGLEELIKARSSIGFRSANDGDEAGELTLEEVGSFHKYGFLPEVIGRFARIVNFPALPPETLRRILVENVLPQFEGEFKGEGLSLRVTETALDYMIARSERRGTGARGLHAELVASVEQAAFDNFGEARDAEILIDVQDGKLRSEVRAIAQNH
ncbi:MAG: AAA family ATPase, partial [Pyrinomonadaceae bacterium]|nr:AAA family ATPase [Pyrinomonadaceae bacterium]